MRWALAAMWCSSLWAADITGLRDLTEQHRFFELRRALGQPGWNSGETLFYRGIVASRFGHEADGMDMLRKFLATRPASEVAREAWDEIASALRRLGRYREAGDALDEELRLMPAADPDRGQTGNTRVLMESLRDIAPMTAEFAQDVPMRAMRNKIGNWNVPAAVNGVTGEWIFDTGAAISTVTQTEAKRLGLTVRQSKAYVSGSTGKHNALQLAVANDLVFGGAHIHNVVFLVLADRSLYFAPIHYQITAILGLPVLRALGRVGIAGDGQVRIRQPDAATTGAPNLYYDELSPRLEIGHDKHLLRMFLDTGANDTTLYPGFRGAMRPEELSRIRRKHDRVAGAGGALKRKIESVPELRIEIAGKTIALKKLSLLTEEPPGGNGHLDGVIGMDALWGGFLLDFDTMRLDVQ